MGAGMFVPWHSVRMHERTMGGVTYRSPQGECDAANVITSLHCGCKHNRQQPHLACSCLRRLSVRALGWSCLASQHHWLQIWQGLQHDSWHKDDGRVLLSVH